LRAEGSADDPGDQLALDVVAEQVDEAQPAAVRAAAVLELTDVLRAELAKRGGDALLGQLELPLVEVLREMEDTGIAADAAHLRALADQFDAGVALAQQEAYAALGEHAYDEAGHHINLGSPKQLQVVLFDKLAMPSSSSRPTTSSCVICSPTVT
jgi:DNA polymerase-1